MIVVLAGLGVIAFAATRSLAESNTRLRLADARALRDRGRKALDSGDVPLALSSLRRAAHISPGNRDISIALAEALGDGGDTPAAARVLESLRDSRPDDVEVNTGLARIAARDGNLSAAIRYYEDALDALWSPDRGEASRILRAEFIQFLIQKEQRARALSQTLVLSADLPPDRTWLLRVGRLFLEVGEPRRALDRFSQILAEDPGNGAALVGGGEAAFNLGDYARARSYLAAAPGLDSRIAEKRDVAGLVQTADPLAPRLGAAAREERIRRIVSHVTSRLDACAGSADTTAPTSVLRDELSSAARLGSGPRTAGADRDRAEDVLALALRVERATAGCPGADALDGAIPIIARLRGLDDAR